MSHAPFLNCLSLPLRVSALRVPPPRHLAVHLAPRLPARGLRRWPPGHLDSSAPLDLRATPQAGRLGRAAQSRLLPRRDARPVPQQPRGAQAAPVAREQACHPTRPARLVASAVSCCTPAPPAAPAAPPVQVRRPSYLVAVEPHPRPEPPRGLASDRSNHHAPRAPSWPPPHHQRRRARLLAHRPLVRRSHPSLSDP